MGGGGGIVGARGEGLRLDDDATTTVSGSLLAMIVCKTFPLDESRIRQG
jgi:hypothetical protein